MTGRRRIYMAGVGGMLGTAFREIFGDTYELKCSDRDPSEPWLEELDFRDRPSYYNAVKNFSPDYLFHIGALTNLEYCETHLDETYSTNTLSVENAVFIANALDIPLLYISTAGIFDGSKEVYDDWDVPNPLCHYARSKFAGELFVRENCRRFLICRAGWMMGGGPGKDKKFVQKIMAQLRSGAKEIRVVNDKLGTPTYTIDFARNTRLLLEEQYWGTYNMVCDGVTGRYEVAQEILSVIALAEKVAIYPVDSSYFSDEYFAPRPLSERLICPKLKLRGLYRMRDWKVSLREYIELQYSNYV